MVSPCQESHSPHSPQNRWAQRCTELAVGQTRAWQWGVAGLECPGGGREGGERERRLLLVVLFAVQFPIPEVAAGGEGLLTRRALQTLLVPGRLIDSHQEAVGDGPLAALADGGMRAVGACSAQGESRAVSPDQLGPSVPAARCPQTGPQGRGQAGSAARRLRSPGRCTRARAASAGWSQSTDSRAERPRVSRALARRCTLPFSGDPALGVTTYENRHSAG